MLQASSLVSISLTDNVSNKGGSAMIYPYNNASCLIKLYNASKAKPIDRKVVITNNPLDPRLNPHELYSYLERQRALEHRLRFA